MEEVDIVCMAWLLTQFPHRCFIQYMAQRISCFGDGSYLGDCTMEQLTELALVTQMFSKLDESEVKCSYILLYNKRRMFSFFSVFETH